MTGRAQRAVTCRERKHPSETAKVLRLRGDGQNQHFGIALGRFEARHEPVGGNADAIHDDRGVGLHRIQLAFPQFDAAARNNRAHEVE